MSALDEFILKWLQSTSELQPNEKVPILNSCLISADRYKEISASDGSASARREYKRQGRASGADVNIQKLLQKYLADLKKQEEDEKERRQREQEARQELLKNPPEQQQQQQPSEQQHTDPNEGVDIEQPPAEEVQQQPKGRETNGTAEDNPPAADAEQPPPAE